MHIPSTWKNANSFVYSTTLLFFVLSLWGIINHELWLDEAHHYLIARDSTSFKNLITNTRYEGHPILWNLILYGLTRITTNPIWMQVLHISIMTFSVGIFFKKAPFPLIFKLLFVFGYFMFYEYNIISRNYSLGILFVFLTCSFYQERNSQFATIAFLLGLACHSHAIFLLLASTIMAMIVLERLQIERLNLSRKTGIGICIFSILLSLSVLQIIPPSDTLFFEQKTNISFLQKIAKSSTPFFKSIFLVPDVTQHSFWNTNMLVTYSKTLAGVLAMISLIIPYFLFYKNKKLLCFLYFGIVITGLFFFITNLNAARYYGILYLFLITALWFDVQSGVGNFAAHFTNVSRQYKKPRTILIYTILGLHFVFGIYAFSMDIAHPFTTAKQTAQYLKNNNYVEKTIATKACHGTALSAYIETSVFFTKTNSYASFCTFNNPVIKQEQDTDALLQAIAALITSKNASIIFVTHEPLFDSSQSYTKKIPDNGIEIVFLKQLDGSIVNKGNHYIYEISSHASHIKK